MSKSLAEDFSFRRAHIRSENLYEFVRKRGGVLVISIQDYMSG